MDTTSLYKKVFPVLHEGSEVLPVTNGLYFTAPNMPEGFVSSTFIVAFYDANDDIISPTAGTITPEMSPIKGQWHSSPNSATINAVDVTAQSAYIIPLFIGLARQGRLRFTGITGANHSRAYFWRGIST